MYTENEFKLLNQNLKDFLLPTLALFKEIRASKNEELGIKIDALIPHIIGIAKNHYIGVGVRCEVLKYLGYSGDDRCINALVELVSDSWVRSEAADILIDIGDPAIHPMVEALRRRQRNIERQGYSVFTCIGKAAVAPLKELLLDQTAHVEARTNAACLLGSIGEKSALDALLECYEKEEGTLHDEAKNAMEKIEAGR